MSTRFFLAAMSVLLGAGCASMTQKIQTIDTVNADYRLPGNPGQGLFIASTRLSTDCKEGELPTVSLIYWSNWYSQVSTGEIPLTGPADKRDIQEPPGYLIVREAKAAEHKLRYFVINSHALEQKTWVPFMVEQGKAVYLGELHVSYLNCYDKPSITLQVRDAWDRDRQLLEKKMKNIRAEDVIKRVLPLAPNPRPSP